MNGKKKRPCFEAPEGPQPYRVIPLPLLSSVTFFWDWVYTYGLEITILGSKHGGIRVTDFCCSKQAMPLKLTATAMHQTSDLDLWLWSQSKVKGYKHWYLYMILSIWPWPRPTTFTYKSNLAKVKVGILFLRRDVFFFWKTLLQHFWFQLQPPSQDIKMESPKEWVKKG